MSRDAGFSSHSAKLLGVREKAQWDQRWKLQHACSPGCRGSEVWQLGAKSCLRRRRRQLPSAADAAGNRAPSVGQSAARSRGFSGARNGRQDEGYF